jgi:hypothetical protein
MAAAAKRNTELQDEGTTPRQSQLNRWKNLKSADFASDFNGHSEFSWSVRRRQHGNFGLQH